MTGKNIPIRTCIVCRREFEKKELLRIVKTKDGNFRADKTGKADGRGAFICRSPECFNKLLKTKFLNKVFKTSVPDSVYAEIEEELLGKNG